MEVHRLLGALYTLRDEIVNLAIAEKFSALTSAANTLNSSPSDASASETFSTSARELREVLANAPTNSAPGSIRDALREAGFQPLTAPHLLAQLNQIFEATPFLMPQATQLLQTLNKQQMKHNLSKLQAAITSLEALNFTAKKEDAHVYEIGVLMPSQVTKDDLRQIKAELAEWIFVIDRVQELVDGGPAATIPVRSMSSGSLDLYCGFQASGAAAMLILTAGAYAIIQSVRDAVQYRKGFEEKNYPQTVIKAHLDYEKTLIEDGKRELVKKLLGRKSKKLPENREHELETAFKKAVSFVLRRINEGVDVEVSTPPEAKEATDEAKIEIKELQQTIDAMRLQITKITALLPERTTPILQLPDLDHDPKAEPPSGTATPQAPPPPPGPRTRD